MGQRNGKLIGKWAFAPLALAWLALPAHGLVVSDPAAVSQRAGEYSSEAARWADQLGMHADQIEQWQREVEEFQQMMHKAQCVMDSTQAAQSAVTGTAGVGDALDAVDSVTNIEGCFTDGETRMAIREAIKMKLREMRETEEAVDEIDESNKDVAAALNELDENEVAIAEEFGNVNPDARNAELLRRTRVQAQARENEAVKLREQQVAMRKKADGLRRDQVNKIGTVSGALEAQQKLMEFMGILSQQMGMLSTAMEGQAVILQSLHQVAVRQLEIRELEHLTAQNALRNNGNPATQQRTTSASPNVSVEIIGSTSVTR